MPHLLTAEEVAEQLSVKAEWVRELALRGELASVKLGRYRRFKQEDVDAYVDAHRVAASI